MKKSFVRIFSIIFILSVTTSTICCGSTSTTTPTTSTESVDDASEVATTNAEIPSTEDKNIEKSEVTDTESENSADTQTRPLVISVLNMSPVDAGMFSVIDPVTNEQINVDGLASGESISLETNWPADIAEFHWALYNMSGELCMDATTDISGANSTVAIILSGEETIEDVDVVYE